MGHRHSRITIGCFVVVGLCRTKLINPTNSMTAYFPNDSESKLIATARGMRLINTYTRVFEEFIGQHIPGYAILSHTWEKEEVSYNDYVEGRHHDMKRYKIIDMTCRLAAEAQISYAWVDTCCIDNRSSAELTEAINSMFAWYERSLVCYVYFSDLPQGADLDAEMPKCRW